MKRLSDSSDVLAAGLEYCQKKHIQAQRKKQSYFLFSPREKKYSQLRQQKSQRRVCGRIPERSMHMVSDKDFNAAELETMRTSRSPATVMTANGEVQTREEATENVTGIRLIRDSDAS